MTGAVAIPPLVIEAVRDLERRLRARFGGALVEVRLFGSHARGEAHEESDVDVLVILSRVGWAEQRDALNAAADVGLERDLLVMPTVMDAATWARWCEQERPLAVEIQRDGVRL